MTQVWTLLVSDPVLPIVIANIVTVMNRNPRQMTVGTAVVSLEFDGSPG